MSALTKESPSKGINTSTAMGGTRQQDASDQLQLVTFEVGKEQFAIDILSVQEINRMSRSLRGKFDELKRTQEMIKSRMSGTRASLNQLDNEAGACAWRRALSRATSSGGEPVHWAHVS